MKPQFANVLAGDGCFNFKAFLKKKTRDRSSAIRFSRSNVRLKYNSFPNMFSGNTSYISHRVSCTIH